jgi:glycosyltransferase involved in cell wall biosynthesis
VTRVTGGNGRAAGFPGGFTVLMAVYHRDDPSLFDRALRSVYANSLNPDSFILVVDGPIPKALGEVIDGYRSRSGFEVIRLPANVGLAGALNAGLELVRTTWVVRADADDYNVPDRFAVQAAALSRSEESVDLVGAAIQEVDACGTPLAVRRTVECHSDIVRYVAYRNPFNHMTVAYRTSVALRCGGYPSIHLKEDYGLWALMLASGARALNLADILVFATAGKDLYRRRGGWRYAVAEVSLQRLLVRSGLKSMWAAVFHGFARATVFLLPPAIRGFIYEKVLRSAA